MTCQVARKRIRITSGAASVKKFEKEKDVSVVYMQVPWVILLTVNSRLIYIFCKAVSYQRMPPMSCN